MVKKKRQLKKPNKSESKRDREPNLFESLYNRKKFDILGKKVKDEQRKRGKARSEGIHKRKNTLLVEYKQRHTANDFIDRRFGEGDEALDESDRAIARFQKQRIKELAGSKFNLAELDDAEQLTHLGASLAEIDDRHLTNSFAAADDDDDADLDPQMVHDLHFGGGFMKREGGSAVEEAVEQPRSKKEVMEEIIAKSKAFKAEKSKQREADLDATEALDRDLADLMSGGALHALIRPKGSRHAQKAPVEKEDAAYDTLRRELVFEAKAKVGERVKSAEEVTEAEHKRLYALEVQQQKRMLDENEGEAIAAIVDVPEGGYAARRAKRRKLEVEATGDTLEDDFQNGGDGSQSDEEEEEEEDGARPTLNQRRIQRASGDHPLQERLREVSRQLLEKHGVQIPNGGRDDQSNTEAEESCDEELAEGGDSDGQEADDGASADMDDAVTNDLPHGDLPASYPKPAVQDRGDPNLLNSVAGTSAPNLGRDLPLVIAVPQTYVQFAKLVNGKSAEELGLAIQRIRHNLQLAADNKHSSQVLYGILVQHFANRAGLETPPLKELDVLTAQLLDLTPTVPLYAATIALARMKRLQESLSPADGVRAWPSHRHLLLLKLWATTFPPSDRRHAVLAPAALLTASYLATCPVNSLQHAVAGIFLSSLGLHMAATTQRVMPEPLTFATHLLYSALDRPQGPAPPRTTEFSLILVPQGGWHAATGAVESLKLGSTSAPCTEDAVVKASCLKAAVGLIGRAAELFGEAESLPELLTPALHLLQELGSAPDMPQEIAVVQQQAQAVLAARITDVLAARRPLRTIKLKREMKQYNPRFEDEFAAGKSYDPDRDRAEARKLKRMLTKERRGAMQELRKDAIFLGEQTGKDKEVQKAELKSSLRSNSAWLQKLEQDFRSGGQGGMWKKRGK